MERHCSSEHCLFERAALAHKRRALPTASETRLYVKRESGRDLATLICGMSGDGECWRRAGRAGVAEVDDAIARVHLWKLSPGWLANATADGRAGMSPLSNS